MKTVAVDGETLTIHDAVAVARRGATVVFPPKTRQRVQRCRRALEEIVRTEKTLYGVTTGFGALGTVRVSSKNIKELQRNLIRSHAAGVGKPLPKDVTRALMLLRVNTLAKGNSGIRLKTLETLINMINRGVHPVIPEKGSVGASGDLSPLAHMTLVMMGEGEAEYKGATMSGKEAMAKAGIDPVELDSKEGIALINGAQMMTAIGALATWDSETLIETAETATALSLEALRGIDDAFDARIHRVRPFPGQIESARNIRLLTAGSKLVCSSSETLRMTANRSPQDPYSLRCAPQVLGAARDAIAYARRTIETELNSATDNPLVFPEDKECLSGGNFHGQPIAVAMDLLGIALTIIGNISERRIARLIDENLSEGLPAFLISRAVKKGMNSGYMAIQYTAASLASENKTLAHPASADSIPTSANFEDFVSMGTISARKAAEILHNVEFIVAIELLCAAQGIDFRGPNQLGKGTEMIFRMIREHVPMLRKDRILSSDIQVISELVRNGEFSKVLKTLKYGKPK
ncbi:MAG: histidine ammonia-lyase [Candidatus Bathyarchaeota archaeon]|nr:MAG: histidine ammonia-lyase [Candidatus Bathyarchaeota archaeon]